MIPAPVAPLACASLFAKDEFVIVMPYAISANRYWQTTARFGHATTYVSKEAKQFRNECRACALQAGVHQPMKGRLSLTIDLHPKRPQDWQKRMRLHGDAWADTVMSIDLGNCEKVLSDALNRVCWEDDKQLHEILLRRRDPDEHGARCVVTIRKLETHTAQKELL